MKIIWISLILISSCTKYGEFSKDAIGINIYPVSMELHRLTEIKWLIGRPKEKKITQSFTFTVDMPKIRQDDLDFLTKQNGIDAWILRLIVNRGSETQDLGSLYTLFRPRKIFRGKQSAGAASNVSFKIYYAAAYASERFRSFSCPAFEHNLKIDSMEVKGEDKAFTISIGQSRSYFEKSQLVELAPSAFNGGNSLEGEYFVEIAPYDSKRKMILSSFKRLPQSVHIKREIPIKVPSCSGVRPEIQN